MSPRLGLKASMYLAPKPHAGDAPFVPLEHSPQPCPPCLGKLFSPPAGKGEMKAKEMGHRQ